MLSKNNNNFIKTNKTTNGTDQLYDSNPIVYGYRIEMVHLESVVRHLEKVSIQKRRGSSLKSFLVNIEAQMSVL